MKCAGFGDVWEAQLRGWLRAHRRLRSDALAMDGGMCACRWACRCKDGVNKCDGACVARTHGGARMQVWKEGTECALKGKEGVRKV